MIKPINIIEILKVLEDDYVLLKKWGDFPEYTPGSDMDLLVVDRQRASRSVQDYLIKKINGEETVLRVTEGESHTHIDICNGKNIILRVDLIDGFDFFTKFSVQDALKTKIFLTRVAQKIDDLKVFVPSPEFDFFIRYLEYLEWFERRPDKIKHLDYILSHSDDAQREQLIENTHRYIRFHHARWQGEVPAKRGGFKSPLNNFRKLVYRIQKRLGIWKKD